jgi:glutaminyl-tRNA synthetase
MRKVPFCREIYIERDDFADPPPPKFFRLSPGKEVRLRAAYYITCTDVRKDATGNVTELHCTYDPATRGGWSNDGRKVKGTLHWVSAKHAIDAEVRLYDRLFSVEDPTDVPEGSGGSYLDNLNPDSLKVLTGCKLEPSVSRFGPGENLQFERHGYFCVDARESDSAAGGLVFNRTVSLKDSWVKQKA